MKKSCVLILTAVLLLLLPAWPCAADLQEQLETKKTDAENQLQELNRQFTELTQEYDELQVRYEDTSYQLRKLESQLKDARAAEAEQREGMKTRIRYMYENSVDMDGFGSLLTSSNFMEFLTSVNQMSELTKYDRQMLEQYQSICDLIEETQKQVTAEQSSVAELKQGSLEKQQELEKLISQTSDQISLYSSAIDAEKDRKIQELVLQLQQQASVASELVEYPVFAQTDTADAAAADPAVLQIQDTMQAGDPDISYQEAGENAWAASEVQEAEEPEQPRKGGYSEGFVPDDSWEGSVLTAMAGVNDGPTGRETYYNMEMAGVVDIMRGMGNTDDYWVRDDGVKMLGDYVMVAANLDRYPRGSVVDSSLGKAIVCDTGGFAEYNADQLDIATAW